MPPVLKLLSAVALLCPFILASDCISACEKEEDETSLVQIKKTVVSGSNRRDQPSLLKSIQGDLPLPVGQQSIPQAPQQGTQPVVQQPIAQGLLGQKASPQVQLPMIMAPGRSTPQTQPQDAMLFGSTARNTDSAITVHEMASKKTMEAAAMQQWQVQKDAQDKMWYKVLNAKKMADETEAMHIWQQQMAEERTALATWMPSSSAGQMSPHDSSAPTYGTSSRTMMPAGDGQQAGVILVPPGQQQQPQGPSTDDSLTSVSGTSEMLGPQSANLAPMMAGQQGNFAPLAPDFAPVPPGVPQVMAAAEPGPVGTRLPGEPQGQPGAPLAPPAGASQ